MIEGITIPYELADQITVANLMDARKSILKTVEEAVKEYDKNYQKENLRDSYEDLLAIDRVLFYFTGKWPK